MVAMSLLSSSIGFLKFDRIFSSSFLRQSTK
jgi:hypothetical protein